MDAQRSFSNQDNTRYQKTFLMIKPSTSQYKKIICFFLSLVFILSACVPIEINTSTTTTKKYPTTGQPVKTNPSPKTDVTQFSPLNEKTNTQVESTHDQTPTEETTNTPGQINIREKDNALEVFIPEGEFWMGCDPDHNGGFQCNPDELPLHLVYLSAYFMNAYEVTNQQYELCVQTGVCQEPVYNNSYTRDSYYNNPSYSNFPVVAVTWYEANQYCEWVGGRLPTEAEWEKAARGSSLSAYPWGDDNPNCELANSYNNLTADYCTGDTAEVGSYPAGVSPYGVHDMAGNVWEWINDWYSPNYYANSPYENPVGKDTGEHKMIHGGSWNYSWVKLRIAYNSNHHPNERNLSFGFRCVRPIE